MASGFAVWQRIIVTNYANLSSIPETALTKSAAAPHAFSRLSYSAKIVRNKSETNSETYVTIWTVACRSNTLAGNNNSQYQLH